MKTLSLKLDDLVFEETEKVLEKLKKPRNRYINEALRFYNRLQRRKLMADLLAFESQLVAEDSLRILSEFENLGDDED
jgi:hypothetical protein